MADLSKLSNAQLIAMRDQGQKPNSLSSLSNEDLLKLKSQVQDQPEKSSFTLEGVKQAAIENLPVLGATVGGLVAGIPGAALGGAGGAGLQGLIKSTQQPETFKAPTVTGTIEATKNIALGGATGATAEIGGQLLSKGVGAAATKVASSLENLAETQAFKAAGAMLKDFRAAFGKDKVNELGRTILDKGLIKAGDNVANIAQRTDVLKQDVGKQIGEIYNQTLEGLTNRQTLNQLSPELQKEIANSGFRPQSQADSIFESIKKKIEGKPGSTGALNKVSELLGEISQNGDHITPQKALEIKGDIDGLINYSKRAGDLPLIQQAFLEVRNTINDKIIGQVKLFDDVLKSPASTKLKELNKLYSDLSTVSHIANDRVARETANRAFGLTDTIAAAGGLGAGAHTGNPLEALGVGAATGLANKLARTRGLSVLSTGANQLSGAAQLASQFPPELSQAITSAGLNTAIQRKLNQQRTK